MKPFHLSWRHPAAGALLIFGAIFQALAAQPAHAQASPPAKPPAATAGQGQASGPAPAQASPPAAPATGQASPSGQTPAPAPAPSQAQATPAQPAAAPIPPAKCEINRPVRFSGLNWESNLILAGIERIVLEKGYGCRTSIEQGETLAMLAALQRGDVDVTPEVWPGQIEAAWTKALASKNVVGVGHVYDAGEAWYIPRYTANAHPDLKNAADLLKFKALFKDPEDPGKGRIFGCPAGWACGTLNQNLLRALKLDKDFNLFAPGAGAAQKAAILSAIRRKQDIVFYYWTPTALVASQDLVRLQLPAFDAKAYACMTDPQCQNPVPTAFKDNAVITGLNAAFSKQAPALTAFFTKLAIPKPAIDQTLAWLDKQGAEPEDAAMYFMKNNRDVWQQWVPPDVAGRIAAAL